MTLPARMIPRPSSMPSTTQRFLTCRCYSRGSTRSKSGRSFNNNNDEHSIHIHVNDFQTVASFDPSTGIKTGPEQWYIDNTNVPVPTLGPGEVVLQPGTLSLR